MVGLKALVEAFFILWRGKVQDSIKFNDFCKKVASFFIFLRIF